jgi:hypothetical protein
MKVGQSHTGRVQLIQVWCAQNRIAVSRNVSITLIVGQNKDDIGSAPYNLQFVRHVFPKEYSG